MIVNVDYPFPWRVRAGAVRLLLTFLFRRPLPAWARWTLLTLGVALIVGGLLL